MSDYYSDLAPVLIHRYDQGNFDQQHTDTQTTLKAGTVTYSTSCYINLQVISTLFQIKESFSHETVPTTVSVGDQKNHTNIFSAKKNRNETGQLQTSKEKLSHFNFLSGDYTKSRFLYRGTLINIPN